MKKHFINHCFISVIILVASFFTGCGSLKSNVVDPSIDLHNMKSAYIIKNTESHKQGIDSIIQKELSRFGVKSEIGSNDSMPEKVDLIVQYEDHWSWDIVVSLHSLNIDFLNPKDKSVMVTGKFTNAIVFSYSNEEKVVHDVIQSMFK
jgi:hypothetical protein